jgi:alkylmercury lyase
MDQADDTVVRRAVFQRLYALGQPVSVAAIAAAVGREEDAVLVQVELLETQGTLRRGSDGRVVGSGGLSLLPTRHEIRVEGRRFWTWCAYDAFGILGALGRGGTVISRSPMTGKVLEARFDGAVPIDPTMAVFIASTSGCRSIVDDWCPLNNLFEDVDSARRWGIEQRVAGTALGVVETAQVGAKRWRGLFAPEMLEQPPP